jgi:peroxiredoxin Q/BCP
MAESAIVPVGNPAPKFSLPSSTGGSVDLSSYKAKQTVVLYFYPRADTPGCTKEACGFRDALAEYDKSKVAVLGISPDAVKEVTRFAEKFKLNFPLLADADHSVCEKYGVWQEKSMYGKKYMGVARTTFVIGTDGRVAHVFEKVQPEGHDQEVLAWIRRRDVEQPPSISQPVSQPVDAPKARPRGKSAVAPVAKAIKKAAKTVKKASKKKVRRLKKAGIDGERGDKQPKSRGKCEFGVETTGLITLFWPIVVLNGAFGGGEIRGATTN